MTAVRYSILASALLAASAQGAEPARWDLLQDYCNECHNAIDWAGKVAFDTLTPDSIATDGKVWESTVRKLRGRLMPPPGTPQPDQQQIDEFVSFLETRLDAVPDPVPAGHVPVQRLNRSEYAHAVRDLLDVDIKVTDLLPPEIEVEGFDNIAAALSVSPVFLDQYLRAARIVSELAVGNPEPKLASTFFPSPGGAQDSFVDGMPLGTRGGMKFRHSFPADGEYRVSVLDLDVGLYPQAVETRHTLVILVDDAEVFRGDIGGPADLALIDREGADGRRKIQERFANLPVRIKAGSHEVVVTFIERARAESDETVGSAGGFGGFTRLRVPRLLDGIQITGPYEAGGVSLTPSRAKVFVCQPKSVRDETACAKRIAGHLARRAFRRPVTAEDVARLMPFFEAGRQELGHFDGGVRHLVTAVLSSPDFLYRAILPPRTLVAGKAADAPATGPAVKALTDLELASRLSFFLWSTGPDDELVRLAAAGRLRQPKVLQQQVTRLLRDPRASALVAGFALKWLNLDDLSPVDPDTRVYPFYTPALRGDFSREVELFLNAVLLEDRSVLDILTADYSFLNERLARHYGVQGVFGPQFRRVQLTDERRFGILGKGATLLRTSYPDRTSPVLRGAWVLEKLMGTPAAPPPPGVETDLSVKPGRKATTIRARLEIHRQQQSCNACHGVIDPIGIALENFDSTGRWRDVDSVARDPIDAKTRLPTGFVVDGPVQLRTEMLKHTPGFVQALTEKLLMYALGRELEYHDIPQVRQIVRAAEASDYRFSSIVAGVVASPAFRNQAIPATHP